MAEITVGITDQALDPGAAITTVFDPACGGVASFVGTVRDSAAADEGSGKDVTGLEYEAHEELAEATLREICESAAQRWGLVKLVALHRIGSCDLSEPTVVIACSAPHRAEALDACRWMIDELKARVPIWKKELYSDGSAWVGPNA